MGSLAYLRSGSGARIGAKEAPSSRCSRCLGASGGTLNGIETPWRSVGSGIKGLASTTCLMKHSTVDSAVTEKDHFRQRTVGYGANINAWIVGNEV